MSGNALIFNRDGCCCNFIFGVVNALAEIFCLGLSLPLIDRSVLSASWVTSLSMSI